MKINYFSRAFWDSKEYLNIWNKKFKWVNKTITEAAILNTASESGHLHVPETKHPAVFHL